MSRSPSLLMLVAGAAGLSIVAHGAALSAPANEPQSRMGVSIQQSLSERDQAAARRNRALDLREQAARAAEQRLKAGVETRQAEAGVPSSSAAAETEERDPYEGLARIYQTMKPAKAARVFEQLELDVQVQVAERMRERSTAMILAAMTPAHAAKLSMAMAKREVAPAKPAGR